VGEEREAAGLAFDVGQHRVGQPGLEPKSRRAGGTFDRPTEPVDPHRPEQVLVLAQRGGQPRMLGASPVEVRPERDHDRHGARIPQVHEGVKEASPGRFLRTEAEHLLQLVDDHERRRAGRQRTPELREWIRTRRHNLDAPFGRSAVRRDEPGADERGLPAPGRPHDGHEATFEEPIKDGGNDLLASEVEVAVLRAEGHQPAVGAARGVLRDRQAGRNERPRVEARCVPHLGKADLRGKPAVDRLGRRVVD
jgi:hypothetical protein